MQVDSETFFGYRAYMARSRQIGINLTVPSRADWDHSSVGTDDTPFAMACLAAFLLLAPDDAQTLKTLAHNATKPKREIEGWEAIIGWVQQHRYADAATESNEDVAPEEKAADGELTEALAPDEGRKQGEKQKRPKRKANSGL